MSAGTPLINQTDARAEEMLAADPTVFQHRKPLTFTTGALSPEEVIESARQIVAHPENESSVSVAPGFFEALLVIALDMPLDELTVLRATVGQKSKRAPRPITARCKHGTLDPDDPNDPCMACAAQKLNAKRNAA